MVITAEKGFFEMNKQTLRMYYKLKSTKIYAAEVLLIGKTEKDALKYVIWVSECISVSEIERERERVILKERERKT